MSDKLALWLLALTCACVLVGVGLNHAKTAPIPVDLFQKAAELCGASGVKHVDVDFNSITCKP